MTINFLNWDSIFFKKTIGELHFSFETPLANTSDFDLLYVKGHPGPGPLLDGFIKTYEETRIVFSKKIEKIPPLEPEPAIISGIKNSVSDKLSLYTLAFISGQESRFKNDPRFSKSEFQDLYKAWINNSFSRTIADDIFLYYSDGRICGLVTYIKRGNLAKVGLFAVSKQDQGKGIGTKLLNRVVQAVGSTAMELVVETQEHNREACRFYSRYGFNITRKESLKHFWRNDTI